MGAVIALAALGTGISVPPGKVLAREGHPGLEFVVVVDGIASVTRRGREITRLETGAVFGEIAILRGVPSPVTVEACTAMTLAVMHLGEFWSAYATMPGFRDLVDQQIDRRTDAPREADYTLAS